ncbi:MobF family relaxase [Cysteiniphilum sp. QT6929]|uniref:MobF family relaxase n=1 Tax=Cysteiniphilum sp. QT6929 TaxID=2975055 RepID=UPI0024B35FAF|nr:MobF family relaxase [Cysteiniphilum sp. QT6929]WHN66793.1 conjugative relaxase [Cysteiniphilum sp. QT6929]
MLKAKKMSTSSMAQSMNIANYYKEEEKHLDVKDVELMTKEEAQRLGIDASSIKNDYGDYVIAENNKDRSLSEWGGALAEKAGLLGKEVTSEQLAQVLEGHLMGQTVQRGAAKGGQANSVRCAGHDIVFSAPKSVSAMALLFGDYRLMKEHQAAVKDAMTEFARLVPVMRIRDKATGELMRVKTDQILYAMETHKVSRNLDPQIHTHTLAINMAMDDEGKLRAINIDDFYDKKLNIYLGKLYQASLNKRVRLCGYKTHATGNGQFNISDIPQTFLDSFSTRRQAIIEKAFALGVTDANTIDKIAQYTRKSKAYIEKSYLHSLWQDRKAAFDGVGLYKEVLARSQVMNEAKANQKNQQAQEYKNKQHTHSEVLPEQSLGTTTDKSHQVKDGMSQTTGERQTNQKNQIVKTNADYLSMINQGDVATAVVELTVSHMARFQTRMRYQDVLNKALDDFAIDQAMTIAELKAAIDEKIQSGEIIPLDKAHETLTTEQQKQQELSVHELLSNQVKGAKVNLGLGAISTLPIMKDNVQAIMGVMASTKQANMIHMQGSAKEAINALIHCAQEENKRIKVLAPNHYHVADLARNTQQPIRKTESLFDWVKNTFLFNKDHEYIETLGGFTYRHTNDAKSNHSQNSQSNRLSQRDIIVVDQAEKLSVEDAKKLLEITQKGKAKIIFLNRNGVQKANGNITETLTTGGIKQFNWHYQEKAKASLNIQTVDETKHHENYANQSNNLDRDQARIHKVVNTYNGLTVAEKANTLIVAATKKEVSALNDVVRESVKTHHRLQADDILTLNMEKRVYLTPEQAKVAKNYAHVERIDFFVKGQGMMSYSVTGIDARNNEVKTAKIQHPLIDSIEQFFSGDKASKETKESAFNPLTNSNPFSLITTTPMEIIKGEKLMITQSKADRLKKGLSYVVHDFDRQNQEISLIDRQGEVIKVKQSELEKSTLQYDYARTLDYVSHHEDKAIIASFKQYALSKEVASELMAKATGSVELITDDLEKARNRIQQAKVQPSVITAIIQAHLDTTVKPITQYVNAATNKQLIHDLSQALTVLNIEMSKDNVTKSVEHVIAVLSDRQAAFEHTDLVKDAVAHCVNEYQETIDFGDVQEVLNQKFSDGEIIASKDTLVWTTKEAIALERSIIASCENGKKQVSPLASVEQTQRYLDNLGGEITQGRSLTKGQIAAVKLITNTQDRFVAVQGYAGTGKSTMLQQAQNIIQHVDEIVNHGSNTDKVEFIGLAPTHDAVKSLSDKNITSQTAQSLIFQRSKDVLSELKAFDEKHNSTTVFTSNHQNKPKSELENKVFLLDESSMVSNKDFADFMRIVEKHNARAVFIGDIKQLESLGAGAPFKLLVLSDKIDVAVMNEVQRQQDGKYLKAVYAVAKKNPELALQFLDQQQSHDEVKYRPNTEFKTPELKLNIVESVPHKIDISQLNPKNEEEIKVAKAINMLIDGGDIKALGDDKFANKVKYAYQSMKIEKMREDTANELGNRTAECRANTLTVLDAHREREYITAMVREHDKENGVIAKDEKQNMVINRLKNLNIESEKMKAIASYAVGMVLQKGQRNYYNINKVDCDNNLLELENLNTRKITHFAPAKANHRFNGLFEVKQNEVAVNEKLIMTRTDKDKGIYAKDKMRVESIDQDKGFVTLVNEEKDNQKIVLDKNNLATLHWDYALNITTMASQGSDKNLVVTAQKSTSPLANMRSLYVTITRGVRHIKMFTDDREALLKRVKNDFNNNNKIAIHAVTGEVTLTEHFDRYQKEKAEQKQDSYAQHQVATLQEKNNDQQQVDDSLQEYDRYTQAMPTHNASDMKDYDQYMAELKDDFDVSASKYYAVKHSEDKAKSAKNGTINTVNTIKSKHKADNQNNQNNQNVINQYEKTGKVKNNKAKAQNDHSNNYANTVFAEKVYDPKYCDTQGRFDIRKYGAEVSVELKKRTEDVARWLLGEENKGRSNNTVLAFGQDSASLKVTLTGKYRGYYKDWSNNNDRGDLVSLIMREKGLNYADAVAEGARMVAMPEAYDIKETKNHEALSKDIPYDERKKQSFERAVKVWNKSHPVKGTLAEKYLTQHRGIKDYQGADVRYNASVYSNEVTGKYQPALVVQFKNEKGELTGIESIYLERGTGKKMSHLKVGKRSYGTKNGSAVLISKGNEQSNNISFLAEGVVTALSIKQAFKDVHILAAGGNENFANIHPDTLKDNILICADNDGKALIKDSALVKAIQLFEKAGKQVKVVFPNMIDNKKTDYNDTLKDQGVQAIFDKLNPVYQDLLTHDKNIKSLIDKMVSQGDLKHHDIDNVIKYVNKSHDIDISSIKKHIDVLHKDNLSISQKEIDSVAQSMKSQENITEKWEKYKQQDVDIVPNVTKKQIIKDQLTK